MSSGSKFTQLVMLLVCLPLHLRVFFTNVMLDGHRRVDKVVTVIAALGELFLGLFGIDENEQLPQ